MNSVMAFTDDGPSPRIWQQSPWDDVVMKRREGIAFEDYFVNTPSLSAAALTGKYASFTDTGGTLVQHATQILGGLHMTADADDNQAAEIQSSGASGAMAAFRNPAGTNQPYDIYFECSYTPGDVVGNHFLGLMEPFTPAGDHITDAGALADKDLLGFVALEGAPTILKLTYKKEGQTVQVPNTALLTMVAATRFKAGFTMIGGVHPASRIITPFINNVMNETGITKTMMAAATFPDNVPMALTATIKNVTDTMSSILHWWRFLLVKN